jgi:hypothetical protein
LALSRNIFEELRETIYTNVLLKAHNYFLVVMYVLVDTTSTNIPQAERAIRRNFERSKLF